MSLVSITVDDDDAMRVVHRVDVSPVGGGTTFVYIGSMQIVCSGARALELGAAIADSHRIADAIMDDTFPAGGEQR